MTSKLEPVSESGSESSNNKELPKKSCVNKMQDCPDEVKPSPLINNDNNNLYDVSGLSTNAESSELLVSSGLSGSSENHMIKQGLERSSKINPEALKDAINKKVSKKPSYAGAMKYFMIIKEYFSGTIPKFLFFYILILVIFGVTMFLTCYMMDTSINKVVEYLIIIMQYAFLFTIIYPIIQMFSEDAENIEYFALFISISLLIIYLIVKSPDMDNSKDASAVIKNVLDIFLKSIYVGLAAGFILWIKKLIILKGDHSEYEDKKYTRIIFTYILPVLTIFKRIYPTKTDLTDKEIIEKEKEDLIKKIKLSKFTSLITVFISKVLGILVPFISTYFWITFIIFPIHFSLSSLGSFLGKILSPLIIGVFVLMYLMVFIVYIAKKLKLVTKISLNGFISVYTIMVLFFFIYMYIFLSSFTNACKDYENNVNKTVNEEEQRYVFMGIIASIIYILIYADSKRWKRVGSILFVAVTIFLLYTMLYYMPLYSKLSIFIFWFLIEWLMLIFKRKENCKAAFNNIFMIHH